MDAAKGLYKYSDAEFSLIENSRVPMAVYQFLDERIVTIALTAGFLDLFGFDDRGEAYHVMDNNMYRDTHPDDVARIANAAYRFAREGGTYEVVYRSRVPGSPDYKIIHSKGEHVFTDDGRRLAVVWYTDEGVYAKGGFNYTTASLNDTLNKGLHIESFMQTSYYDSLTGLPNATYFFRLAEHERKRIKAEGGRPAMVFADFSGMKNFNRQHGFVEGDKLLGEFAKVLAHHFGNENCSRFGQDHFAVVTDGNVVEKQLQAVFNDALTMNGGQTLPIRCGIYLDEMESVDAGTAYDRAKAAGDALRNTQVSAFRYFNQMMLADTEKRQYIIDNFERALEERWIQVYHQPIIRSANGQVCDEEALARWVDPMKGLLSPADFIPVLEETQLIYKLDLYMLDRIIEKMEGQSSNGLYIVPESLNLSRVDFDMCDIVEEIRKRVDASEMGRDKITIEITESVIGSDFEFMKEQIHRFQSLGFKVWMDDFGSGYSSLDLLQSIPFDLIKFDMRFMQNFGNGEESKIILTELVKMAMGLGIETIAEGVETQEQVDFLREIGCSKLQGFFFCCPLPIEKILERYENDEAIGFENPQESDYYAAIGGINLYDMSVIGRDEDASLSHYFDTLPMAVIESTDEEFMLMRCNSSYRTFMEDMFGVSAVGEKVSYDIAKDMKGYGFLQALRQCSQTGNRAIVDEELADGSTVHAFIRRVASNSVTGMSALVVLVLAIIDKSEQPGTTYASIARALSADYAYLYYVDIDTDEFIEYSSDASLGELDVEQHGKDFFAIARRDAVEQIYAPDRAAFLEAFQKDRILASLDEMRAFAFTYRLMIDGEPRYVNMKAVRMKEDDHHIIIGVNDVDVQIKQREAIAKLREERVIYARMAALAGNYLGIYTVDPETEHYSEYLASRDYEKLGLPKEGENFFEKAVVKGKKIVHPDDYDVYVNVLTKENVLADARSKGIYSLSYRLVLDGEVVPVRFRAALVEEDGEEKLIVGINKIVSGADA